MTDQLVAETAADVFRRHCSPEVVRRAEAEGWSPALWRELEASGLTAAGTALPLADAAQVVRVAAAYAAPVPLAETVLAGWLRGADAPAGPLTVVHAGRAPYGRVATALLSGDGFVPPGEAGLEAASNLAGEPLDRAGVPDAAGADVRRLGALLRSVQLVGAMEHVLELTATYAEERRQFGVPLVRFQAVQQQLAQLAGEVASAATVVEHAIDFPGDVEVAAAKIRAGEAAAVSAAIAHQVHGAIGMTDEHVLGIYTRRLWSWRDDFGGEAEWARLLGAAVLRDPGLLWVTHPLAGRIRSVGRPALLAPR
jgi:acyl-CoA dehydrogenase